MPDYEVMYHLMVNAAEDALKALEGRDLLLARRILIEAELEAEALYVEYED